METSLKYWKLENKIPVECGLFEWAEYFESRERLIRNTQMPLCWVSTVFLGIDHSFCFGPEKRLPILFESMIFDGSLDGEQWRYATYKEAEEGHEQLCGMAEKAIQNHSANIMISILGLLLVWMVFD